MVEAWLIRCWVSRSCCLAPAVFPFSLVDKGKSSISISSSLSSTASEYTKYYATASSSLLIFVALPEPLSMSMSLPVASSSFPSLFMRAVFFAPAHCVSLSLSFFAWSAEVLLVVFFDVCVNWIVCCLRFLSLMSTDASAASIESVRHIQIV